MRGRKAGLADLKRLHDQAQTARKAAHAQEQARARANTTTQISQDSVKLFARATQAVQPLQTKGRVMHPRTTHGAALTHASTLRQSEAQDLLDQKRRRATGESQATPLPVKGKQDTEISDIYAPIQDTETEIAWAAPGIGSDTQRRLRQAFWPVGAHLDLHGMNTDQARAALLSFIDNSQQFATRCIRIVHGQGYGSINGQGVLKNLVTQWLTQIPAVSAFTTAPQSHGGRGALLVLLRQS